MAAPAYVPVTLLGVQSTAVVDHVLPCPASFIAQHAGQQQQVTQADLQRILNAAAEEGYFAVTVAGGGEEACRRQLTLWLSLPFLAPWHVPLLTLLPPQGRPTRCVRSPPASASTAASWARWGGTPWAPSTWLL